MPSYFQIKTFFKYWLEAVDEHSLHSPFFYDFYTKVIKRGHSDNDHTRIENLRKKLLHDRRYILIEDMGGGSFYFENKKRKISAIANTSLTKQRFSELYASISQYLEAKIIIELGTSFGINTLYLSQHFTSHVTTFEGSREIIKIAHATFAFAEAKNIKLIEGNINTTLPSFLQSSGKLDLVLIDANHRYEPTLKYFDWFLPKMHYKSVLIVDDIHQSKDMERAWNEIRLHSLVYGSVDLYRCGIIFFDPSLNKQHVVLQF